MNHAAQRTRQRRYLVLGVGNTLLQDDGVGIHVTRSLREQNGFDFPLDIIDGGTIGLSLLPKIEDADALIIVDAAELGQPPGSVRVFVDREVDAHLTGKKRSVHEVAVLNLLAAAGIRARRPALCALVAIQPLSTQWGLEPTPDVRAAIPTACDAIRTLTRSWER